MPYPPITSRHSKYRLDLVISESLHCRRGSHQGTWLCITLCSNQHKTYCYLFFYILQMMLRHLRLSLVPFCCSNAGNPSPGNPVPAKDCIPTSFLIFPFYCCSSWMTCSHFLCRCSLVLTSNYSCPQASRTSHLVDQGAAQIQENKSEKQVSLTCTGRQDIWSCPVLSLLLLTGDAQAHISYPRLLGRCAQEEPRQQRVLKPCQAWEVGPGQGRQIDYVV